MRSATLSRAAALIGLVALTACSSSEGTDGNTTGGGAGGAPTSSSSSNGAGVGGATGSGGGGGGPVTPAVSSWLGTNLSGDLPRVDVAYQLNPFDTPAGQKDENGYPVAGASGTSGTDIGFILPSGTYAISYQGTGKLDVSGIGSLAGAWTTVSGEQRNQVQITGTPGEFGHFLYLTVTNAPGQTVTDIHLYLPGVDYDTKDTFTPQFLSLLAPFRALRFKDWMGIDGSTLADWQDRPKASSFGHSPNGEPYEHIVGLVNATGKDMWINVPEHATDDFVKNLADFVRDRLDFQAIDAAREQQGFATPFKVHLELSNETWNGGYSAYATFLAAAQQNPAKYDGTYSGAHGPSWMAQSTDLMRVAQYEGDRLVQVAQIFEAELDQKQKGAIVTPVLAGWALGAAYSDAALAFIQAHYGAPKDYVGEIAIAPYFGPDDAQTDTLANLFASAEADIASKDATFQDFAQLGKEQGIPIVAYEGGEGIAGAANQPIKHLAQHDARMAEAYQQYFALWKKDFGEALFMHFTLAGYPGLPENIYQYGYWGSIIGVMEDPAACAKDLPTLMGNEDVASVVHHCPKYATLAAQVP